MKKLFKSKFIIRYSLFAILLLAASFRFYGLNWDQGHNLHPDERMIVMVTERLSLPKPLKLSSLLNPNSPLNPKFFAYGNFPLYLLKAVSSGVSQVFGQKWATYSHLNLIGRILSVIFDLGTVFLIFKIGEKTFSPKVAILASFFYAVCVFPIQLSHFYAVDIALNFFILLTLYRLILFYEKQTFKQAVFGGISFGLALATKVSATALVVSVGTALIFDHLLIFLKRWRVALSPWWRKILFFIFRSKKKRFVLRVIKSLLGYGLAISLSTIITFIIFQPYALIDFPTFWRQITEQRQMTKNAFVFPYTLQFVETPPYIYHLKNLWLWGMGIGLGTLSIIGAGVYMFNLLKRIKTRGEEDIEAKEIILVVFFLAYFLTVGRFAVKFMRYLLPLYPLFSLFAAWFLQSLIDSRKKGISLMGRISLIFVSFASLLWMLAFISIYSKPNTRVSASQWINQNISSGAKIAVEHWDDRLPMWGEYQFLEMPMYDPDSSDLKWQRVSQNLEEADYIILASNRLYTPLQKLSDCQGYKICYPKTAKYYQKLFNEELGFKKVAEITSYPTIPILNWQIPDDKADENFTVFDHPKVIIFKSARVRLQPSTP